MDLVKCISCERFAKYGNIEPRRAKLVISAVPYAFLHSVKLLTSSLEQNIITVNEKGLF